MVMSGGGKKCDEVQLQIGADITSQCSEYHLHVN